MAYKIEPASEQNVDTPLTNFPVSEDTFDRMSDVSADLMSAVIQYNEYQQAGNIEGCNTVLTENPGLVECLFNADKYNQLRDSIIAMERFLLNQVDQLYNAVVQNAIGIKDNPTAEEASTVSYSAEKINQLYSESDEKINRLHNQRQVTLLTSGWSDTFPYSQTVTVDGILSTDDLKIIGVYHPTNSTQEEIKTRNKMAGYLINNNDNSATEDNTITFLAYKKPTTDFTIITEGG